MKTKKRRKVRLYGKDHPRMPKPVSTKKDKRTKFSLRMISEADSRFAVVKQLRRRLEQLLEETGADTIAKEWLAGRAVFILSYLESLELDAFEGVQVDMKRHLQACKSLSDILSKLGLDREAKSAVKLKDFLVEQDAKKRKST